MKAVSSVPIKVFPARRRCAAGQQAEYGQEQRRQEGDCQAPSEPPLRGVVHLVPQQGAEGQCLDDDFRKRISLTFTSLPFTVA